jgi:CheY-like chemotaxis protein
MVKVLFLDDDSERWNIFNQDLVKDQDIELIWVKTSDEAIKKLKQTKWDIISLDHDLGGQSYVESGLGTGYEVAKNISEDFYYNDKLIFVHSWNPEGAKNMRKVLKKSLYIPFNKDLSGVIKSYAHEYIMPNKAKHSTWDLS